MANTLLTLGGITREAIRLWKNSNAFVQNIDKQFDSSYEKVGAKIGSQLKIRLPNDYTVRTGQSVALNNTSEVSTTLTVGTQKGVDLQFTSQDLALSMDDFSKRVLAPAINNLAGSVASDVMSGSEAICNYVSKTASGAVVTPTSNEWLSANASLDIMSAPKGDRKALMNPRTQARTVQSLTGLFNPTGTIAKQFVSGEIMGPALGIGEWMSDQTAILHTTATFTAQPTVNGANQTGTTLTVNATAGAAYNVGDVITIAGVHSVNRITKQSTGELAQFAVTAVYSGGTSLQIYPAITPLSSGNSVQYQTVDASPANGAAISCVNQSGEIYRKNFVFRPEAATLVTADLPLMGGGVVEEARETFDGVSMRMIKQYSINTDQLITRLDILYGYLWVRPEWACVVADAV